MKNILGLDLGVSSIGWAYVNLPTEQSQNKILGMGTRIIPLSTDEKSAFEQGQAQTKNKDRTIKRSTRRNLFRYKLRREFLRDKLSELDMLPGPDLFRLTAIQLYGLRAAALDRQITLKEIGRVLLHINQKRGFRSSRKDKSEESNKSEYKQAIEERNRKLEVKTVGQYYYEQLKLNPTTRIKKNILYRANYISELNKILEKQKTYYPELITNKFIQSVCDEIIFYQRKLKSQKHLIGGCAFEHRTYIDQEGNLKTVPVKVCPLSNPLFQEAKIWQSINNIQIRSIIDNSVIELEDEMRTRLYELILLREKTSWEQILKHLGLSKHDYRTNVRKDLTGDPTRIAFAKAFKELGIEKEHAFLIPDLLGKLDSIENLPLIKLWHILYSVEDPTETKNALIKHFQFTPEQAQRLSEIQLKEGFGNLSSKALKKILPHLIKGFQYSDACNLAGYKHSQSETREEKKSKKLLDIQELKLIGRGELRNPAVERILNQLINLLKDIYAKYGVPDVIRVELARELKQNAEQRNQTFRNNNQRERLHEKIRTELETYDIFKSKRVSNRDIEKYKLWEEFDKRSPYQPNKEISLSELFSKEYEVEHIVPKSRLFDDSFANKCIAHVRDNKDKDNDTAYDFMKNKRSSLFDQYCMFIQDFYRRNERIHKLKFERLMTSKENIPQDFINRQLNETQYITKKAKEILGQVCKEVWVTSGAVTDYLRHIWGYDNIIHDLHFPAYKEMGLTEVISVTIQNEIKNIERIKDWTKRLDHRHHAVDALVVACTNQAMIHSLNNLNQFIEQNPGETKNEAMKRSGRKFEAPFHTATVSEEVAKILISFKPGKKVASISKNKNGNYRTGKKHFIPRGSLHEETIYGIDRFYEKIPLGKIKEQDLDRLTPSVWKERILLHIEENDGSLKSALNKKGMADFLKKFPDGSQLTILKDEYVTRYALDQNFKVKDCDSIIDAKVRKLVRQRLADYNDNPKDAFKELHKEENRIWLDKSRNLFVEKVTCRTGSKDLEWTERGYVKSGNNHHVAVYEDQSGKLYDICISFWEAFERKRNGIPIIEDIHPEYGKLKYSIQQNEMFIFDLSESEVRNYILENNLNEISKKLYRFQKTESGYKVVFRHHLSSTIDRKFDWKGFSSFQNFNGLKVKIDRLGQIIKIGNT